MWYAYTNNAVTLKILIAYDNIIILFRSEMLVKFEGKEF